MKRWQLVVIASVVILGLGIIAAYHLGVRLLQGKIIEALGPGSHVSELKVNWFSVELSGLAVDAPKAWPTARTLEAERVIVIPDLRTLLTDQIRVASIVVEKPYLSLLRNPGKLNLVPSLTEKQRRAPAGSDDARARAVTISSIEIRDGIVDLYDATVSRPPLKTTIVQIEGVIRDVTAPAASKTRFDLAGIVKGIKRDGRAKATGWVGPGGRDSYSRIALLEADLVALQPYLVKKHEARVSRGTLDLNLDSDVRNNYLNGKGKVVLKKLEFAPARGFYDTFMGIPRNSVIGFLQDNNGAIDVDFTLTGDVGHPNFSLNESLSTRVATAMAGQLGVSVKGVAEGLGTLGRRGLEGAGDLVEGVGAAVRQLFGGATKQ